MPPGCVRLQQSARGVGDAAPYSTDAPGRRALTRIFTKNIGFPYIMVISNHTALYLLKKSGITEASKVNNYAL